MADAKFLGDLVSLPAIKGKSLADVDDRSVCLEAQKAFPLAVGEKVMDSTRLDAIEAVTSTQ